MSMQSEVIAFIAEFTGADPSMITLETLVNDDLGVDGDDGADLLLEFSSRFDVDISNIDKLYFGPEGINPLSAIFSGVSALLDGLLGRPDKYSPLPVKQFVYSAEAGKWVNI